MFTRLKRTADPRPKEPVLTVVPASATPEPADDFIDLRVRLHQRLITDEIDLTAVERMPRAQFESEVGDIIRDMLKREAVTLSDEQKKRLVAEVLDELLGLGPLEPLLKDHTINDIIVTTSQQVCVERAGKIEMTPVRFRDDAHLVRIINKIVAAVGRRIDESSPIVDARLRDGSRVNAVIPPVAVDGPLLSIRKFAKLPYDLPRLVGVGTITPEMQTVLEAMVRGKLNILISGGTGSGKTTMLNALSAVIDHSETIVTVEDAAELQLQQPIVRRLETRPPNVEGKGSIMQRELVVTALRMRPNRIILGEVRNGEAFDMLQAMNTGHEGSMSTIHANTPRDALSRLEQMIGMAGMEMAPRSIRNQIASAIHVVVQLARGSDGRRRLTSIHEITGMEGDVITANEIFRFRRTSTDPEGKIHGYYESTGIRPRFAEELATQNLVLPTNIFAQNRRLE
ncbi:MAG TPA: CpaF family protein [Stellaceae bacterium]|nr:CpaF family protein [Stellaceae bacterium]